MTRGRLADGLVPVLPIVTRINLLAVHQYAPRVSYASTAGLAGI
jgi:hypothetical protein